MGKKNSKESPSDEKKGKRMKVPFSFLGTSFDSVQTETVKKHLLLLIFAIIITKFAIFFVTTFVFHSFVDYFDIGTYLEHVTPLLQGQYPYLDYPVEYPVLSMIPIFLAFIPAVLTQNAMVFVLSFQALMVLCDVLIVVCVYFIGLKIWNEETAFRAGLLYATAFSTAYFVITKSDAFPTLLLMAAILFTVYGMKMRGYISVTLGFFTKVFPAIALPFLVFYNAKSTSLRKEIITLAKVFVPAMVILVVPLALLRPEILNSYLVASGTGLGIYVNTATYTLYAYLQEVLHLGISPSAVSVFMYAVMAFVLLLLLYIAWAEPEKKPVLLLKLVLGAIVAAVFFTKFHSPQYILWFTPLLCLLVADNLFKIALFYITQIFAYIEFPLMFNSFYTNQAYVNPVGTGGWYVTLGFFTLQYLVFIVLMYMIFKPRAGVLMSIKKFIPYFSDGE